MITKPRKIVVGAAVALGLALATLGTATNSPASAQSAGYTAYAVFFGAGANDVFDIYVTPHGLSYDVRLKNFATNCEGITKTTKFKIDPLLADASLSAVSLSCTRPDGTVETYPNVSVAWKASKPIEFVPVGLYRSATTTATGIPGSGSGWMGLGVTG